MSRACEMRSAVLRRYGKGKTLFLENRYMYMKMPCCVAATMRQAQGHSCLRHKRGQHPWMSGPNSLNWGRRARALGIHADVVRYSPPHIIAAIFGVILRHNFDYIDRLSPVSRRVASRTSSSHRVLSRPRGTVPLTLCQRLEGLAIRR